MEDDSGAMAILVLPFIIWGFVHLTSGPSPQEPKTPSCEHLDSRKAYDKCMKGE